MPGPADSGQGGEPALGYAAAAVRGSAWTALQVTVNKLAAAGVTLVLGFLLSAEQFGIAWFAISSGQFALLLPVVGLIDVLIASPRRFWDLSASAQRIANRVAWSQAALIASVGMLLAEVFPERHGLAALMAMVALRPLADAVMAIPLSGLRIELKYREISSIDCGAALASSALSVAFAWAGFGPAAIVLPPIAAIGMRGMLYRRVLGTAIRSGSPPDAERVSFRRYVVAATGWYLAGTLYMLELVVLGSMSSTRSVGLFAFAFGLASQLNGIVSFQVAGAIQPIISHLADAPVRQTEAALRAIRMIVALIVPLLLVQGAVGGSVIRQLWPGKWEDAVLLFQVISVAQALYACQWPAAFVLRAQGRFSAYLKMQAANVLVAGIALPLAVLLSSDLLPGWVSLAGIQVAPDTEQPLAVAFATFAIVALFSPLMLYVACRPGGIGIWRVLDVIWRPVVATAPVAAACAVIAVSIEQSTLPRAVLLLAELGIGTAGALAGIALSVSTSSSTRSDALAVASRALSWATSRRR